MKWMGAGWGASSLGAKWRIRLTDRTALGVGLHQALPDKMSRSERERFIQDPGRGLTLSWVLIFFILSFAVGRER